MGGDGNDQVRRRPSATSLALFFEQGFDLSDAFGDIDSLGSDLAVLQGLDGQLASIATTIPDLGDDGNQRSSEVVVIKLGQFILNSIDRCH
jgi:hypothetical protein